MMRWKETVLGLFGEVGELGTEVFEAFPSTFRGLDAHRSKSRIIHGYWVINLKIS